MRDTAQNHFWLWLEHEPRKLLGIGRDEEVLFHAFQSLYERVNSRTTKSYINGRI